MSVSYSSRTESAPGDSSPSSRFPPLTSVLSNTVSDYTDQEGRPTQVSPPTIYLPFTLSHHFDLSTNKCQRANNNQPSGCPTSGLTPISTHSHPSQTQLIPIIQKANNHFTYVNFPLSPTYNRPTTTIENMGDQELPFQVSPGSLMNINATSLPNLQFTHFVDTRGIPYEDECSVTVISKGSLIPGSNLRYVNTHIHGRPSLSDSTVFARPAKNLASDLNGRPSLRPLGRGRAPRPRSSSPTPRGRGGRGGRSPSPQDPASTPVSAPFLASRINMAIGNIQSSSRSISPAQIIFKAFDRNGLPDDTQLQQSGPTTFFLKLDAISNPEAVAALCNGCTLSFPLHPSGKPLAHKNWIFENPITSDIGPAVSENHTVYITFGVSPALTREQIEAGIQPTPEIPLLWDCDEFLANKKLRTATLFLHMAATTAVDEDHPFHSTKQICDNLLQHWNFSFVRLLGLSQHNQPSTTIMDHFCLAAQADSLHSTTSLAELSPVHIPIVTDQCDMPLAVFTVYISLDNPVDSVDETTDTDVTAEEEQLFRNHSIQISCQVPADPEFIVSAWSAEILKRMLSLINRDAETQSRYSNAEDAIIPALKNISSIELLRVNASANVRVPRPYRVDPRHTSGSKTKLVTVAPVNPRVVQFALSPRGSSRLQVFPPSTSHTPSSPVSLFVGTAGIRLHNSSNTISLPPTSNRAKRLAVLKEIEKALTSQQPPNPAVVTPPTTHLQPPTYASLFHKPATPPALQQPHQQQGNNPLFLQHPTNMDHDSQDPNQVCLPSRLLSPRFISNDEFTSKYYSSKTIMNPLPLLAHSNRFCISNSSLLNNTGRPSWRSNVLQMKPIYYSRNWMQPTKTEMQQLLNWLPFKPTMIQGRQQIWFILVGPSTPLPPATLTAGAPNAHTGGRRKNCTTLKLPSGTLSLLLMLQATHPSLLSLQVSPKTTPIPTNRLTQEFNPQLSLKLTNRLQPRSHQPIPQQLPPQRVTTSSLNSAKPQSSANPNPLLPCHSTPSLVPLLHMIMYCPDAATQNQAAYLTTPPFHLLTEIHSNKTSVTLYCHELECIESSNLDDTPNVTTPTPGHNKLEHTCAPTKGRRHPKKMTAQCNVIKVPCYDVKATDLFTHNSLISIPSLLTEQKNFTVISLVIPPQIILVLKLTNIILTPILFYSNPCYLLTLALEAEPTIDVIPFKCLTSITYSVILFLSRFYTLVSTLHLITFFFPQKRYPRPSKFSQQSCTHAPVKSWLNTLPDRYGSTILTLPNAPWPNRSFLNPQWRPAPPHKFVKQKTFTKISKTKWNKYVRAKNKECLLELNYILQIVTPHVKFPTFTNSSIQTTNAPCNNPLTIYFEPEQTTPPHIRLSALTHKTFILALLSDPRILLLILLMCAGDVHPNPGPPNISPTLLSKHDSSTPLQLTQWIRKQDHRSLVFGDPNGQPYIARSDMLSGFFQEYLDKTDQTNLLTKILRYIYSQFPNLSQTAVKVVNTAEEHEMQRGQTPHNWLNSHQETRAIRERAEIMSDPLNCKALVIPRVANAHFTTYIFHPEGIAYYDSLSFSPDSSIISKYCEALNKYYASNPTLATSVIQHTLAKISTSTPVSIPCTQQTPESRPWSCGYCSANICIQAVLQQSVPRIDQSLSAIYELQSAYLK